MRNLAIHYFPKLRVAVFLGHIFKLVQTTFPNVTLGFRYPCSRSQQRTTFRICCLQVSWARFCICLERSRKTLLRTGNPVAAASFPERDSSKHWKPSIRDCCFARDGTLTRNAREQNMIRDLCTAGTLSNIHEISATKHVRDIVDRRFPQQSPNKVRRPQLTDNCCCNHLENFAEVGLQLHIFGKQINAIFLIHYGKKNCRKHVLRKFFTLQQKLNAFRACSLPFFT